MKNNKFTKILIYSVCSLVLAGIIFLAISYFGKDYEKQKIGDKLKEFDYEDIKKAVNILYVVSLIATISFIMVSIIIVLLG